MELKKFRDEIDKIDSEMIKVLSKRIALIPKISEYKKKNDVPRFDPEREVELISHREILAEKLGINPELVTELFKLIIKESHRIEKKNNENLTNNS